MFILLFLFLALLFGAIIGGIIVIWIDNGFILKYIYRLHPEKPRTEKIRCINKNCPINKEGNFCNDFTIKTEYCNGYISPKKDKVI